MLRFHGVIRVAGGEVDGLRPKWGRGYGRWVRDVLVWTKAPFYFRNELVAADGMDREGLSGPGEIKRLGDHPVVMRLTTKDRPIGAMRAQPRSGRLGRSCDRGDRTMGDADVEAAPRVLLVFYSYTQQGRKVAETMADVFRERGCQVDLAAIEFTDARYADRFTRFPLRHVYRDIFGMMPAQLRSATGEIRIPDEAKDGGYDLICIGSPTWWIKTSVPIRSFLHSDAAGRLLDGKRFAAYVVCRRYWGVNLRTVKKLGTKRGGTYVDGIHFSFAGGQVRSLLALISFFGAGENRERYLGVKIPPTNLKPDFAEPARAFAGELADGLVPNDTTTRSIT